jgi:N-acetylglutamate synthase-like GNAT family acetyltransferase
MKNDLLPEISSDLLAKNCSELEFESVKKYIKEFELDDRMLKQREFLTISDESGLVGFGRLREYGAFWELCSLGVVKPKRAKGFGKKLSKALIEKTTQPIYLVCVIPSFFMKFGFSICTDFPEEIREKLNYCINQLSVEEQYVVMKKN